jgi:hypothetical protein
MRGVPGGSWLARGTAAWTSASTDSSCNCVVRARLPVVTPRRAGLVVMPTRSNDAAFDTLPMIAVGADGDVASGTCPSRGRHLVDIPWPVHPEDDPEAVGPASADVPFGCWPAVPLQTNFDLDITGQRYCVLFSG